MYGSRIGVWESRSLGIRRLGKEPGGLDGLYGSGLGGLAGFGLGDGGDRLPPSPVFGCLENADKRVHIMRPCGSAIQQQPSSSWQPLD